ncbi:MULTISPECIES: serine hydrolase domain-containing protein [Streptomyces]|uniref:Serine hydrolase n=1 Tax=Streptomyces pseudovenezuelae TaxID=67350 RepID=A0A101N0Q2_9ACTN|nr:MULTISPECIES: serine hydrolase domain-containing protein [Streptomyces]KUM84420.1 serine hydrolase [Streptomyces pseudovenezuelae]
MTTLHDLLETHVGAGTLPGAVGLVAQGDQVEVAAVGAQDAGDGAPMARDSIFRVASITKSVTAAALLVLVEEGRIALDDPIGVWLPELGKPVVVRTPASPVDEVVPADRPITVFDVLASQAGCGFPSDFTLPVVQELFTVQKDGRVPSNFPPADEWMAALGRIPLLYQPGAAWLYDTCSVLQGVLISRVTGQPLPEFLAERIFGPLGMMDTGFEVPAAKRSRFTSFYRPGDDGSLELADGPDGEWSSLPALPLGNGGLASTADDWLAFCRMLLAGGVSADGRRVLSADSVRMMTTDHTNPAQRDIGRLFLEGQGWGFGGSVDIDRTNPWNTPGRYGWVGGTGTAAHVIPATGTVTILLTQVAAMGPVPAPVTREFWRYAADA